MRQYFNWKTYLILAAACIAGASIYYTHRLAAKLADEERKKMEQVAEGIKIMVDAASSGQDLTFASTFVSQNTTIPFIVTDEKGNINQHNNFDTNKIARDSTYLRRKLEEFKAIRQPIVAELGFGLGRNYVYYGESYLLTQLRYFPYVQLTIIMVFLIVVLIAFSSAHRSIQNQVWVGLSKETAHQLGTPLSSIEGWLEILKEDNHNADALGEMQKDLDRLKLVADRFGKVGSVPVLEEEDIRARLKNMVEYMQKRSPARVAISIDELPDEIPVAISGPLFDWVIENLMRNALDAMEGRGTIHVSVADSEHEVKIDITDTGKGIAKRNLKKIFNPGFTTKTRGWGLGLSLSRRIIQKYHRGSLFVKQSEPGKGTTFRILLRR